jgi:hypothetical protein
MRQHVDHPVTPVTNHAPATKVVAGAYLFPSAALRPRGRGSGGGLFAHPALQHRPHEPRASRLGRGPGAHLPGRIVADVPRVAALQLGRPVAVAVLPEAGDAARDAGAEARVPLHRPRERRTESTV